MTTQTLLIIGHGYTAAALSTLLAREGNWRVIGTTRTPARFPALRAVGAEPLQWPGTDLEPALRDSDYLLASAAPGDDGDPLLATIGPQFIQHAGHLRWVGYLSTTGVYGNRDGAWVDETSPLQPTTRRGQRRVEAEAAWSTLASQAGFPLHIFRLAGIYGVGRGPVQQLLDGRRRQIVKQGQVFNRIHVDDIARILRASMSRPRPNAIYNVCDDLPSPPQIASAWAARRLNLDVPVQVPFDTAEMSPMARSFYSESKRVRNTRIKQELGITLLHPDYRSGFAAVIDQGSR